jgi:hypothetical protein
LSGERWRIGSSNDSDEDQRNVGLTEGAIWHLIARGTRYVLAADLTVFLVVQVESVVVQAIVAMIVAASASPFDDRLIQSRVVQD